MKLSKPKAILFDWDNTLADTWPVIHSALSRTFIAMGMEPWSIEDVKSGREGIHKSLRDSFPKIFNDKWEEAREYYYKHFLDTHLHEMKVVSGAEKTVKHLAEKDVYVAVVSNKTGQYLRQEVEHLGWNSYFSRIIGATDAANDKPHPDPVHMALDGSGIESGSDVWFIGDSETDLECAIASRCVPIFFGEKEFPKEYISDKRVSSAIIHVKNHSELLDMLNRFL